MLVNMSLAKRRQMNSLVINTNGTAMSFCGISASFIGMFASKTSYGSPTPVSVLTP